VARNRPDLALEANRRAVTLNVSTHEALTPIEADGFASVYAHEAMLSHRNGKRMRSSKTWQDIKSRGIVAAITKIVSRASQTDTRSELRAIGLEDLSFEAFVLRHEDAFGPEAVQLAKDRLAVAA
jgi:hypothetical protein